MDHRPERVWQVNHDGDGFLFSVNFHNVTIVEELQALQRWLTTHDVPLKFKENAYFIADPDKAALFKLTWC